MVRKYEDLPGTREDDGFGAAVYADSLKFCENHPRSILSETSLFDNNLVRGTPSFACDLSLGFKRNIYIEFCSERVKEYQLAAWIW